MAAQRVHHQLLPKDTIYFDAYAPLTGKVDIQAIRVNGTQLETASDPRGRGVNSIVGASLLAKVSLRIFASKPAPTIAF